MPIETTAGTSFHVAENVVQMTTPARIHMPATPNRNIGFDGRRPTCGVGSGSRAGRPEGVDELVPPFAVTRPPELRLFDLRFLSAIALTIPIDA